MPNSYLPGGRYFEEFELGDVAVTAGRTVTEADVVSFAGLSGDYTQIHTNEEYAKAGFYGRRIAYGILVLGMASGLLARLGFLENTVLAFHQMTWKFSAPVYIGDTVHVQARVTGLKAMRRAGGGSVSFELEVINQDDKVVQRGTWELLVAARPA
jgi:3-hydroxybutyryl-CoA dehydratase